MAIHSLRRDPSARRKPPARFRRWLCGEVLEDRLALAWLGIAPANIAIPAAAAGGTFNAQQDAQGTAAITAAEVDYYTFLAPATGSYRIAAQTPSSSLDTVVGVFSSAGQRLSYNDDFGGSTDSQVTLDLTAGARYYLGITNYTGSASGAYTWIVDGPTRTNALADDAYEQNDSFGTARNLGALTATASIPGLVMADGNDWYRFQTSAAGGSSHQVTINFQHAQGDVDLELYNASGVRLAGSISVTNQEQVSLAGRAAGTYYVRVYGYRGATNPSYSLTIAPPSAATSPPATIDLAGASLSMIDAAQWGQTHTTQASIRNNGTAASGAFQLEWYLSRDSAGSSDDVLLARTAGAGSSYAHGSIAAGGVGASFTVTLQLPAAAPAGWTGTSFYIVMRTDSTGQVAESNENNNFGQVGNGLDREAISIAASGSPAFPDVPYYGGNNEWNLNAINAPEVWAQGYTGEGVVVAVIDTGVDWDHSDLVSQMWVNPGEIAGNGLDDDQNGYVDDIRGWDFIGSDNDPDDANGHGTHVAGTIAAAANGFGATGVAPDATIMPVRVLGANGSGSWSGVAAGIRYAAQMGADIINLSLGGPFSSLIQSAIQFAQQRNVLVVAAAGNESASVPGYPARFSATLSNVLSVGAHTLADVSAGFSNDVGASGAVQVDAPGVNVYSTARGGGYTRLSGTSMATPHVAGLAALALSANGSLTASQLRSLIVSGATRTISGSDSGGGINAAVTVALAAAGQTSSSAASGLTTPTGSSQQAHLVNPLGTRTTPIAVRGPWGDAPALASLASAAYEQVVDLVLAHEAEFNVAEPSLSDLTVADISGRLPASPCEGVWS